MRTVIIDGHEVKVADKVAIVGFASSSKDQAPFSDPSFDIWIMNDLYRIIPRWNMEFEMHEEERIKTDKTRPDRTTEGSDHWKYLCSQPGPDSEKFCPIFMLKKFAEIPASVEFDLDGLAKYFGQERRDEYYFTSTPAYMMAMAIMMGYGEIHLYGVDLLTNEEYAYQRPCLEYYLGVARGKGIKVYVPRQSALLKSNYVYGYSYPPDAGRYGELITWINSQKALFENSQKYIETGRASIANVLKFSEMITKLVDKAAKSEDKAAAIAELRAKLDEQAKNLANQDAGLIQNLSTVNGSLNAVTAVVSWAEHLERGGALISE